MMTYDELRKKCFELECALGTAMKLCDQMKDETIKNHDKIHKLAAINIVFADAIKSYVHSMDKSILIKCIEQVHAMAKILNK